MILFSARALERWWIGIKSVVKRISNFARDSHKINVAESDKMMENGMYYAGGYNGDEQQYMEQEEEWEREGLLDPAWEKQQKKVRAKGHSSETQPVKGYSMRCSDRTWQRSVSVTVQKDFVLKMRQFLDGNYITGRRSVFIFLVYWLVMCGHIATGILVRLRDVCGAECYEEPRTE